MQENVGITLVFTAIFEWFNLCREDRKKKKGLAYRKTSTEKCNIKLMCSLLILSICANKLIEMSHADCEFVR